MAEGARDFQLKGVEAKACFSHVQHPMTQASSCLSVVVCTVGVLAVLPSGIVVGIGRKVTDVPDT